VGVAVGAATVLVTVGVAVGAATVGVTVDVRVRVGVGGVPVTVGGSVKIAVGVGVPCAKRTPEKARPRSIINILRPWPPLLGRGTPLLKAVEALGISNTITSSLLGIIGLSPACAAFVDPHRNPVE
jgi:hypothetical protein